MRVALRESFRLRPGGKVHENVADFGLDPKFFLAVVDADFGVGGKVNLNRRVYPVADFRAQNAKLADKVKAWLAGGGALVDGEEDHPDWNPTFRIPLALCEIAVREDEKFPGKAAIAGGKFAFIRTRSGEDLLTLYRIGLEVGFSSRGTGFLEDHLIDEQSPYWDANEPHRNAYVGEVRGWDLEAYDAVRVPSAGTFARREKQEAAEAYARLVEAGIVERPTAAPPGRREDSMTLEELKTKYPDLYASVVAKATSEAVEQRKLAEGKLQTAEQAVGEQRVRVEALEKAKTEALEKAKTAEEAKLAAEKAKTEAEAAKVAAEKAQKDAADKLAARELADALAAAVVDAVKAAPEAHRTTVETEIKAQITGNKLATAEGVKLAGESIVRIVKDVAERTAKAGAGVAPTEAADGKGDGAAGDGGNGSAAPAPTVESALLTAAIERTRLTLGV